VSNGDDIDKRGGSTLEREGDVGAWENGEASAPATVASPYPPPEPATPPAGKRLTRRLTSGLRWVWRGGGRARGLFVVALTTVGTVLSTLFLIRPNLVPTTENRVSINSLAIEPDVTLGQYMAHPTVVRGTPRTELANVVDYNPDRLNRVGTVVHLQFEVGGYGGKQLSVRWTLFDATTGRRLGESEDLDPLPLQFEAAKRDVDIGSWETWIDTAGHAGRQLFVRFEIYDDGPGSRLTFKDTEKFPAPLNSS
jgi:hypothetical protein